MRQLKVVWILYLLPAAACAGNIFFEPNRGQAGATAAYFTHISSGQVFFAADGSVSFSEDGSSGFELVGADPQAAWEGSEPDGRTTSYFLGRDPNRWLKDIPHYARLTRRRVYNGIDVTFYVADGRIEYDFLVAPHADPARIRFRFRGTRKLEITSDGDLVVETDAGELRHHRPVIYETLREGGRRPVNGTFKITGREVSFAVGRHDGSLPLSIDPVLEFSTFYGGHGDDKIVATNGSIIVGTTTSIDVPGASLARRQGNDIFVQYSQGQTLVFGGAGDEQVTSAAFTGAGAVVVGGYTNSRDLPMGVVIGKGFSPPQGAWQTHYSGGASDGFLLFLSLSGSNQYGFMSYIGTEGEDRITGVTFSPNFAAVGITNGHGLTPPSPPAIYSPFQADLAGGFDGFFLTGILTPVGVSLSGVTYLGGSGDDSLLAIIGSSSGGYYVAGETRSPNFPFSGGYSSQRKGESDAFVARIRIVNGGITLDRATLFGGSGADRGTTLVVKRNGEVLVAGATSSPDLPLANPLQPSYGGGTSDAFFAQFTPDLSRLTASTYYGGSGDEEATALNVDYLGNVFLAGWTSSLDFPVKDALQSNFGGGPDDSFLVHLDVDGSIHQATYLGGSGSDRALGLFAPGGPTVWISGSTTSPDMPLLDASQKAIAGPSDGWMMRVTSNLIQLPSVTGGKDLRVAVAITLGNSAIAANAVVSVSSSDPARVMIAGDSSEPGQASIQVPRGASLYVDCLVDSVGADLTLSAAGYQDRSVHVSCFPPSVLVYRFIKTYPYRFV